MVKDALALPGGRRLIFFLLSGGRSSATVNEAKRTRVYLIVNGLGKISIIEITGGIGNTSQGEFLAPENREIFLTRNKSFLVGW